MDGVAQHAVPGVLDGRDLVSKRTAPLEARYAVLSFTPMPRAPPLTKAIFPLSHVEGVSRILLGRLLYVALGVLCE